jgi:hypothetical protein
MRVTTLQTPFLRVILVLLVALVGGAPGPARADNPYAVVGISDPVHVTQFLVRLKLAMAADDHAAIAAMVKYPLTVYSSGGSLLLAGTPPP